MGNVYQWKVDSRNRYTQSCEDMMVRFGDVVGLTDAALGFERHIAKKNRIINRARRLGVGRGSLTIHGNVIDIVCTRAANSSVFGSSILKASTLHHVIDVRVGLDGLASVFLSREGKRSIEQLSAKVLMQCKLPESPQDDLWKIIRPLLPPRDFLQVYVFAMRK